jgi:hypothetical protein
MSLISTNKLRKNIVSTDLQSLESNFLREEGSVALEDV